MNQDIQNFDLFDAYTEGNLSSEELRAFTERLVSDQNFHEAYNDYIASSEIVKEFEINNIKNILDNIDYTKYNDKPGRGKIAIISAGAILLAGLSTYLLVIDKKANSITNQPPTKIASVNKVTLKDNTVEGNKLSTGIPNQSNQKNTETNKNDHDAFVKNNNEILLIVKDGIENNGELKSEEPSNQNQKASLDQIVSTCDIQCIIRTIETCKDKSSGSIIIDNIKGGTAPYKIQLTSEDGITSYNTYDEFKINNLIAGGYSLSIKDNAGSCSKAYDNIWIKELAISKCIPETKITINPNIGDTWACPETESTRTLEIKTFGGSVVFKKSLDKNESFDWAGTNNNGSTLSPGIYYFTIENNQGQLIHHGNITIVQ